MSRCGADSVFSYIDRAAEKVPGGVRWRTLNDSGEPQYRGDLYSNGGIPLFLADYFRITGNPRALELAVRGAEWCSAPEREFLADRFSGSDPWCLLGGRTGLGLAWLRIASVSGERDHRSLAAAVGDVLLGREPGPTPGLSTGAAGRGVFLLRLWEQTRDERYLTGAVGRGEWLAQHAIRTDRGVAWPPSVEHPGRTQRPLTSICHGIAACGYFLLLRGQATGDAASHDLARGAADALSRDAREDRGGLNWLPSLGATKDSNLDWQAVPVGRQITRCQWCNGAPGIGLFFTKAYEVLRDESYLRVAEAAGEATYAHGDGRRNPTYCHGLAGNTELLIELGRITRSAAGAGQWLNRARELASTLYAYRVSGPTGDMWPGDAPPACAPDFMCGAAGTGHAFLRLTDPLAVPMALL